MMSRVANSSSSVGVVAVLLVVVLVVVVAVGGSHAVEKARDGDKERRSSGAGVQAFAPPAKTDVFADEQGQDAVASQQSGSAAADARLPKYGLMRMEWQTPIYHVEARSFDRALSDDKLRTLRQVVLANFNSFVEAHGDELVNNSWEHNGVNDAFFTWQREGGWERRFKDHPIIQRLQRLFHLVTDTYLHAIGVSQETVEQRDRELQAWATVHRGCMGHPQHTHPNNMVSGVFYVAVPEDAGPIVFSDPRGPYPGLDGTIVVQPKAGDLILFPSWLPHQVMPTACTEPRISIAFNMPGDWADTASVAAHFPLTFN
ncbi:hypothetical protein PTSG_01685 [Salpingoeca rosetta]|uniref:Fe2OG dioxygenase domain-containing protein n=1 Tax=Salpingoeca rosetta (strain ATCC 50818 / BSB-021) TaxID=946362 RepID=F2TYN2_SALR5|nr:uncharacterized protein PTSG_01685 [Salpingoeca rosetta]EGD78706.1 hypothetical protein PTSG_01685 [Salpingoeca rosetta]|eukprot:XP_004997663.1 hypothetical protein PTSG_01685 [Salpingoeca rosetta]